MYLFTYLLMYLFIYLLNYPIEQSPSWEAIRFAASQKKFPAFYGTRKFITAFRSARHLSLSWASSIQSIPPTSHFLKFRLNIILPSMPESPHWPLTLRFVIRYILIKVKQSNYRPWQALRVPGGWGSQILRQGVHEGDNVFSPTHRSPLPPGCIPGTHFC
jgi:hypothetical protein